MRKVPFTMTAAVIAFVGMPVAYAQVNPPSAQNEQKKQEPQQGAQTTPQDKNQPQGQAQGQQPNAPSGKNAQQEQSKPSGQGMQGQAQQPSQPNTQQGQTQPANQPNKQQGQTQQPANQPNTQQGQTQPVAQPNKQQGQTQPANQPNKQQGQTQQPVAQPQNQQSAKPGQDSQGHAQLNQQQQTRVTASISTHIKTQHVQPITNVNFSLSVGTRVPADVRFYTLPADVVEIVPQYRGYSYFVVDEQIVIVEPNTKEIVMLLPYSSGRASASTSGGTASQSQLTSEQRSYVRKHVTEKKSVHRSAKAKARIRYEVGETVPEEVEVYEFPETVYTEVPQYRSYRYLPREEGGFAVIEPRRRAIIDLID